MIEGSSVQYVICKVFCGQSITSAISMSSYLTAVRRDCVHCKGPLISEEVVVQMKFRCKFSTSPALDRSGLVWLDLAQFGSTGFSLVLLGPTSLPVF